MTMYPERARNTARPAHWIGVRAEWDARSGEPWDELVSLPPPLMRTHVLIVGATGSGKTNLVHHLIAQDVLLGNSFAVLDMRGDLVRAAAEICAGRADPARTLVLDLRERERPAGFDPLYGAGEPYFRALGVLDAVAAESESWGVQLAETLRNALMLLAERGEPLTRLEDVFHDRAFLRSCVEFCLSEPVVAFWRRYEETSKDKQGALAMPVLNKVSALLATETLRRVLGHPRPVDLGAHLDTSGSVTLVSLAVDETHASGRMMGRLFLSSACREVFSRVHVAEGRRNPVRLYVDEFEHFGTQEFEGILAEGRRFGLSLVLAHQTLAQLSPKMRSMVLGNVGTKFVFRCGREDGATLSKDLTGDPRALDLSGLPVGRAAMWNRSLGLIDLEVNEPIVRDSGSLSPAARRFVREAGDRFAGGGARAERPGVPRPNRAVPKAEEGGGKPASGDDRGRGKRKGGPEGKGRPEDPPLGMEDWLS